MWISWSNKDQIKPFIKFKQEHTYVITSECENTVLTVPPGPFLYEQFAGPTATVVSHQLPVPTDSYSEGVVALGGDPNFCQGYEWELVSSPIPTTINSSSGIFTFSDTNYDHIGDHVATIRVKSKYYPNTIYEDFQVTLRVSYDCSTVVLTSQNNLPDLANFLVDTETTVDFSG